ncbi:MAG: CRTAC1 family protein [Pseudomonadales bacterium]|nr:CRTAC1 family protein [Pseudomonadales bacterium]
MPRTPGNEARQALARGAICSLLATASPLDAEPVFVEVGGEAGLEFTHINGMVGERWLAEIMGAGVAVLDFDGDDMLDVWLVQGGPLHDTSGELPCDRLFRNVSAEVGELKFVDVTGESGVCASGYGMGVATADIDLDGDLDVFVANFGPNQLYENLGDGRFRDATAGAGLRHDDWSVSASFADLDGDLLPELFVANYVDWTVATHKVCRDDAGSPSYCSPEVYRPSVDRLYRNRGGFEFVEIGAESGIGAVRGAGLGVIAHDFDADRDSDFYVANDMNENRLWVNQGGRRFVDSALLAGVAVNGDGNVEASMGIDAEDFDHDCDIDIFVTHLAAQTNTLYANEGDGWFADRTNVHGAAAASIPFTGFGTGWFDADNDGDLDLFAANGAVTAITGQDPGPLGLPLRQRNQFWRNDGGRYTEIRIPAFEPAEVSRGTAFADFDNDGDLDILVTNNRGPARLYRNDSDGGHWIGFEVVDSSAPGSEVWLESVGCGARRVSTDGSYASANDPRVLFGLGENESPQRARVRWPDGEVHAFGPLDADRYHILARRRAANPAVPGPGALRPTTGGVGQSP